MFGQYIDGQTSCLPNDHQYQEYLYEYKSSDKEVPLPLSLPLSLLIEPFDYIDQLFVNYLNGSKLSLVEKQKNHRNMIIKKDYLNILIRYLVKQQTCAICQEKKCDYMTSCHHTFHLQCLQQWTTYTPGDFLDPNKTKCPSCRTSLESPPVFKEPSLLSTLEITHKESLIKSLDSTQVYRICLACNTHFPSGPKSCMSERDTYPDKCEACHDQMVIIRCPQCDNGLEHMNGCLDFVCCCYGFDKCIGHECDHGSNSLVTFCGHSWTLDPKDVSADCGHLRMGRCYECGDCDQCCTCGEAEGCGCRGNGECEYCRECDDCCTCLIADCDCRENGQCKSCGNCDDCCKCKVDTNGMKTCDSCELCHDCCTCSYPFSRSIDLEPKPLTLELPQYCTGCKERSYTYDCGCTIMVGVHGRSSFKCLHCDNCASCCTEKSENLICQT